MFATYKVGPYQLQVELDPPVDGLSNGELGLKPYLRD